MKQPTLLLLQLEPRKASLAIKNVMKEEDFTQTQDAASARALINQPREQACLFVVSREGDWAVVAGNHELLDLDMATAIAEKSQVNGWIVEPQARNNVTLWAIKEGQRAEQPQLMPLKKAQSYLQAAGVAERLYTFAPKEHLEKDDTIKGRHEDIILGYTNSGQTKQKSEVEVALGKSQPKKTRELTLDQFLESAIHHEKVRAIAKAQIAEQLKRDGFTKDLEIFDPEPEGHFCEAYDAESHSFTSNGPYVWFDWSCEEACDPRLAEEHAFPSCDLRFYLEKTGEL